jgi:outer membrane protein OmpA-like peptidoglycan-associated protein
MPFVMQAQLGNLMDKAKNKVKQRVDNKVDNAMDKTLDDLEGKKSNQGSSAAGTAENKTATPVEEKKSIVSYSKFDFVPGNKVVYAEDFSQDEIGELPMGWNTNNRGEVVTIDNFPGKWLRMIGGSKYLTANKDTFGQNFTIEFDLIYDIEPSGYLLPSIFFGMLSTGEEPTNSNKFFSYSTTYQLAKVDLLIAPRGKKGYSESYRAKFISHLKGGTFFTSESKSIDNLGNYANKVSHVSIQVQGSRMRCWINDFKAFDMPMALPQDFKYNQLYLELERSNYKDHELGYYIGNIKVATGKPDTRHKFIEEGKFSTTGILFNVNSAEIKPESAGVLKEIASVLKDNGNVKVKVIGHTDSDGDDKSNLELSKKRAASVKVALEKDFGIDGDRIVTDGMGESKPVADNKTKEGKMQNRRVEFIKL